MVCYVDRIAIRYSVAHSCILKNIEKFEGGGDSQRIRRRYKVALDAIKKNIEDYEANSQLRWPGWETDKDIAQMLGRQIELYEGWSGRDWPYLSDDRRILQMLEEQAHAYKRREEEWMGKPRTYVQERI